jgi:hypothetical protein
MEERFVELAKNKDITDEDLFEELRYLCAKSMVNPSSRGSELKLSHSGYLNHFKEIRKSNPSLSKGFGPDEYHLKLDIIMKKAAESINRFYCIENYEMKQRIRALEQTLASFMEQTKVERVSQEAVMQSLSNELDEFQEEFYDCQSEVKEQKERIGLLEDALKETIQTVLERVPLKDKTD